MLGSCLCVCVYMGLHECVCVCYTIVKAYLDASAAAFFAPECVQKAEEWDSSPQCRELPQALL